MREQKSNASFVSSWFQPISRAIEAWYCHKDRFLFIPLIEHEFAFFQIQRHSGPTCNGQLEVRTPGKMRGSWVWLCIQDRLVEQTVYDALCDATISETVVRGEHFFGV